MNQTMHARIIWIKESIDLCSSLEDLLQWRKGSKLIRVGYGFTTWIVRSKRALPVRNQGFLPVFQCNVCVWSQCCYHRVCGSGGWSQIKCLSQTGDNSHCHTHLQHQGNLKLQQHDLVGITRGIIAKHVDRSGQT